MRIYPPDIGHEKTEELLREEVLLCHAPVTGIFVASAIFTEKAVYFEHNYERENPVFFEHSETRALENIIQNHEQNPKIRKIMLAAGGKANKFKSYIPCYSCSVALGPYVQQSTEVLLLELPSVGKRLLFGFEELNDCYKALPYSRIEESDAIGVKSELADKTFLSAKDLDFVTSLTLFGKKNMIPIYLTGSSTRRGGAGTLLNAKTGDKYRDVDIFVIMKSGFEEFEKSLEELISKHYGVFIKTDREVPTQHNPKNVVFKKTVYSCGDKEAVFDFTFSTNFEGTLAYHAYEVKNWFHQLS